MEPVKLIHCLIRKVWICILICLEPLRLTIRFLDQMFSVFWSLITKPFWFMTNLALELISFISGTILVIWSRIRPILLKPYLIVRQIVDQIWEGVKSTFMGPFLYFMRIWKETRERISAFLEPFRAILRFVGQIWNTISTILSPLTALLRSVVQFWHFVLVQLYELYIFLQVDLIQTHREFDATKLSKKGQLAVVTGGGRGIGCQVVKKLLQADMDVIIGLRNPKSGHELLAKFREEGVKTGTLEVFALDLLSLKSVREFAKKILDKNRPVYTLVNNAGIMFSPYEVSEDGFESHFQVNYLSHFLLTQLLMPRLKEAGTPEAPSRVVNVSSSAHYGAWSVDFKELQVMPKEHYNPYKAYSTTKFLQVASANYWNQTLKDEGANVTVNSLHPGIVATELYNQLLYARIMATILGFIFMSIEHGADTVAYAAISPKLGTQGGIFLANSQPFTPNKLSFDLSIQKKLWDLSQDLVAVK